MDEHYVAGVDAKDMSKDEMYIWHEDRCCRENSYRLEVASYMAFLLL